MKKMIHALGQSLRDLRDRAGLTLDEVVSNLEVHYRETTPYGSRDSVSRLERHERMPSRTDLVQLLIVGLKTTKVRDINRVLEIAEYNTLNKSEIETYLPFPSFSGEQPPDDFRGERTALTKGTARSVGPDGKDVSRDPVTEPKFNLSVDGIILNSVGDIIFERASDTTIAECRTSYERSLEDFAFALVYGSEIWAKWDARNRDPRNELEPAELLIRALPSGIYRPESLDRDLFYEPLFEHVPHQEAIRNYVRSMNRCMREPPFVRWCRDLIVRESATYLGVHSSLFSGAKHPYDYQYGKEYCRHQLLNEVPSLLGSAELETLVDFVPKNPREAGIQGIGDPYDDRARTQFVVEIVLTHITNMYQHEKHAERHKIWRVPYGLRAEITRVASGMAAQERLRRIVLGHALQFALRKISVSDGKIAVVQMLAIMRNIPPFEEIREMLASYGLTVLKPHPEAERKAKELLHKIYKAGREKLSGFLDTASLAHNSVLRDLARTDPDDYKPRLYELFPELTPRA